jgi:hypothetical protein
MSEAIVVSILWKVVLSTNSSVLFAAAIVILRCST